MLMRVVIAEDEWLIAAALRRQVESYGHEVVGTAGTGMEALALCRERSPDLVLMDVQMPGMDGLEATRTLMQEAPTCVVIVTGRGQLGDVAARAGAMSYVVKPLLGSQIPPVVEDARRRFEHFQQVYREAGDAPSAMEVWSRVLQAVAVLTRQGRTEQDAFLALVQDARNGSGSLRSAAELVLGKSGVGREPAQADR